MIDLNAILIGTRQYLLNELDGLPAAFRETQNKAQLVLACQKIVESDLLENSDLDDLVFLKTYFENSAEKNDKVTPYFSRLLLLKFLYEETIKDANLIQDKNWFSEMRDKLNTEFEQLKNGQSPIKINNQTIHSLSKLQEISRQAREEIRGQQRFFPVLAFLAIAILFRRTVRDFVPENMSNAWTLIIIAALLNRHRLADMAERGRATLFAAQRAAPHFRPENINIMNSDAIKKFFLLSDDELNVFNKGPELK
ncbi:MAG: hypothetical protein SFW07_00050 [Gammaproteobacteria bacterium]|nr:hypothetical protein [Gammaproteobacteria bacterium]